MEKNYIEPEFEFVCSDGQNRVFFAASGVPTAKLPTVAKTTEEW